MSDPAAEPRLGDDDLAAVDAIVAAADERMAGLYPGPSAGRQPVHTVYVPADKVTPDLTTQWGAAARATLDRHAPTAARFSAALGLSDEDTYALTSEGGWDRLLAKLDAEPIEDLRIDVEDGYGTRSDDDEDQHAVRAARALADMHTSGVAPPFCGIRFKSLDAATRRRGIRTLDLVIGTLFEAGGLPPGWVLTLPKVTSIEQVQAMVELCARLARNAAENNKQRLAGFLCRSKTFGQVVIDPCIQRPKVGKIIAYQLVTRLGRLRRQVRSKNARSDYVTNQRLQDIDHSNIPPG